MITIIRKSFKTRIYKIVLWITLLTVGGVFSVFELAKNLFGTQSGNQWILQINHHKIFAPEFMRSVADQEERIRIMRAQYGQYADFYFQMMGMKLDPQALAIDSIIRKTLLNEVATRLPLRVSSETAQAQLNNPYLISQEFSDLAPFSLWDQSIGGINRNALHNYLQNIGVSISDFNDQLALAVKRNDIRNLAEHAAYVPEFELKQQFANNFLGHKFSILTISSADTLAQAKKEAVSDEKLKAYYDIKNAQENRYRVPEKRSAKVVSFDPAQYGIVIIDQDIEKHYNNNKAQFIEKPIQVQVRHILFKVADAAQEQTIKATAEKVQLELIKNPETFAAKAKEFSQDSKTASQGGLMPYFSKGQHDKTFERAAFLLKNNGDISALTRTNEGFEIVQLVDKKLQAFKPLSQVSKDIAETLRKKKFAERFASDVRAVLNQSNAQESLAKFVKEKNGKESTVNDMTSNGSILSKTLFSLPNKGTSFYQEPNQGVVVTVTSIKQSHVPALDEIKDRVKEDYYKDEAAKLLSAKLKEITNSASFDAAKNKGTIDKTGWLRHGSENKDDQQEIKQLQTKGIDLGKMFQLENKGGVTTFERNGNGFAIRLDDIAPFDQKLFEEKKATLGSEQEQQKKSLIMGGFVASLYRNAKINKNESLIRTES